MFMTFVRSYKLLEIERGAQALSEPPVVPVLAGIAKAVANATGE